MTYSWEVFAPSHHISGVHVPMNPRRADVEKADSPQEIADRYVPTLLPGQRLNVWDVLGVGKAPVLIVDHRGTVL